MYPQTKKSLGQHFLTDPAICKRIVNLLDAAPDDNIMEIGPGPGSLTRFLRISPHANLILLEKDYELSLAQQKYPQGDIVVINCDALEFGWKKLAKSGKWKIIGNLPYNIASPLIWNIVSQCASLSKAIFMVQKEVGQRLTAAPGNKEYGALTVWVKNFTETRTEFHLSPGAFTPPPKVNSSVISFIPLKSIPAEPEKLKKLINLCFQKRRKQLGTIFRQAKKPALEKGLADLGIDAEKRPENLTPAQFQQLAVYWE